MNAEMINNGKLSLKDFYFPALDGDYLLEY